MNRIDGPMTLILWQRCSCCGKEPAPCVYAKTTVGFRKVCGKCRESLRHLGHLKPENRVVPMQK